MLYYFFGEINFKGLDLFFRAWMPKTAVNFP